MPARHRRNPRNTPLRRRSGRQSLDQSDDSDSSDDGNRSQTRALDEASEPDDDTYQGSLNDHATKANVRDVIERLALGSDRQTQEIVAKYTRIFMYLVSGFKLVLDRMPPKYSERILPELQEHWRSDEVLFRLVTSESLFESAAPGHGATATQSEGIPAPVAPARTSVKRPASPDIRKEPREGLERRGKERREMEKPERGVRFQRDVDEMGVETLPTSNLQSNTTGRSSTRGVQSSVPRIASIGRSSTATGLSRQMNAPAHPNPAALHAAPSAAPLTGPLPAPMPNLQASVAPSQTGAVPSNRPPAPSMAPSVPPGTWDTIASCLQMLVERLPPHAGPGHLPTGPPGASGVPLTMPQLPEHPPVEQNVAAVPGDNYAPRPSQLPQGPDMPTEDWMSLLMDGGQLGGLGLEPGVDF